MVFNSLTFGPLQAFYHLSLELVKEGPVFVQHLIQFGICQQSQENPSILEVEVLVHCRVKLIDPSPIVNFSDSFRLDGVDNCLDDRSWRFFGNQVVEELVQLEALLC